MRRVLVLHGPNLNLEAVLGRPLAALDAELVETGRAQGLEVTCVQANGEAALLDALHQRRSQLGAVVVNPSSLAPIAFGLADALEALALPCVEVLLTHESKSRGKSALRRVVDKQFHGHGAAGYLKALSAIAKARPSETAPPPATALPKKTIGRAKAPVADRSGTPASKTIGRTADAPPAAATPTAGLTRAEVKRQVMARLAKSVQPDDFAAWARAQWLAVQNGATAEPGVEDLLLMLSTSAKASDHVILSYAAKLAE